MSYLLDTTHVVDHPHDDPDVVQLLATLSLVGIAASAITYLEAFQGTIRLDRAIPQAKLDAFLDAVPVLPVTIAIAQRCAQLQSI